MNALDEAREHVEVANSIGTSPWGTEHSLNLAMVKATIELAEQQRIANLIAWSTRDSYHPSPAVQAQIEKGLGL